MLLLYVYIAGNGLFFEHWTHKNNTSNAPQVKTTTLFITNDISHSHSQKTEGGKKSIYYIFLPWKNSERGEQKAIYWKAGFSGVSHLCEALTDSEFRSNLHLLFCFRNLFCKRDVFLLIFIHFFSFFIFPLREKLTEAINDRHLSV